MARIRRFDPLGRPVFVTVVTHKHMPYLTGMAAKKTVIDAFRRARVTHPYRNLAHVILDDHFHWLMCPDKGVNVSDLVGWVKQHVAHSLPNRNPHSRVWQRGFWDHVIRNERDYQRHFDYIHFNPVKHGYVRMPCQYRWSSFNAWVARDVYPKSWGMSEPDEIVDMTFE